MKTRNFAVLGLIFLLTSQLLFSRGFDFLQAQRPIDFAHWFLLIGACCLIAFNFVFPKGIFNTIASVLTSLGVIAHIGMCAIDFVLWSYRDNQSGRNELIGQLINIPSIWYPFMVVGPSLLYIGLATHIWPFIKSNTIASILTLIGSLGIGLGQFISGDRMYVLIGCLLFAIGLLMLLFRKESVINQEF